MQQVKIYGQSAKLQEVLRAASLVAMTNANTLISGETGTGKSLLAQFIHENSPRVKKNYIHLNCATAFKTSTKIQNNYIVQAKGGTLVFDEIFEMPAKIQAALLYFLETGKYQFPNYHQPQKIDVRIIATSQYDLAKKSQEGSFRKDLFYRLNTVPLELPPLKIRTGDITLLINQFFTDLVRKYRLSAPIIDKLAMKKLEQYHWAGNIRELHNFCERMLILFSGKTIYVENLPQDILRDTTKDKFTHGAFNLPLSGVNLKSLEIKFFNQALQHSNGNKSKAARLLGLTRDTFLYRMKKYHIHL